MSDPTAEVPSDAVVDAGLGSWIEQVQEVVFYVRVACRSKGYALAVHGTLRRDVDVVAVPWTEEACAADELAQRITESLTNVKATYEHAWESASKTREEKPFGRIAWSIPLYWKFHTGAAMYLDLSVAPRVFEYKPDDDGLTQDMNRDYAEVAALAGIIERPAHE